jgi:hypothetical protein
MIRMHCARYGKIGAKAVKASGIGALALFFGSIHCVPEFSRRVSRIDQPRLLGVISTPAEAAPGEAISLRPILADATGPSADIPSWAFCLDRLPSANYNSLSDACLTGTGAAEALGTATELITSVPKDSCGVFGSEPPPPQGDAAPLRPADPDETGGYFRPVRVVTKAVTGFARIRVTCPLQRAPIDVALRYRELFTKNQNPPIAGFDAPESAAPSQVIKFSLRVDPTAEEVYPIYTRSTLVTRRERLTVRWYSTRGTFAVDQSSVINGEATVSFATESAAGTVYLWALLEDDRGGLSAETRSIVIR